MTYQYDQKPATTLTQEALGALELIKSSEYSVLVGRNNCGKSFLLKTLTQQIGQDASYLGPARYQNFNILGYYTPNRKRKQEKWNKFIQQWQREQQNFDNSPVNLQQAIAELPDNQRTTLFEIVELLLGTRLEILHTVPNNSMSQKYINSDGHNLSYTSSGFRLIMTLVTSLLDTDYDTFLIDEPELGISPEAQGILADFLFDRNHREKYFPHVKSLILATHSTIFLDRLHISNNYSMSKSGDMIDIKQTQTLADFNNINFFLLGNRLETLYLPSCIVLTEGKCDHAYITKALDAEFPELQLSIINANSDSRMKEIVNLTGSIFTDLQKSPYRTRIIAVLDKVHGTDVIPTLTAAGIPEENIVVWSENGIEYYYPEEVLNKIYGAGGDLEIIDDRVRRNGIEYKKWDLCQKVVDKISDVTIYPKEMNEKLFNVVKAVNGLNVGN